MQEKEIIKTDPKIETICCDGGEDSLGHPAIIHLTIIIKLFVVIVVRHLLKRKISYVQ